MSVPTTRTNESAHVFIDQQKCNDCGLKCVEVCKDFTLIMCWMAKLRSAKHLYSAVLAAASVLLFARTMQFPLPEGHCTPETLCRFRLKNMRASYASLYDLLLSMKKHKRFP